MRKLLKIMGWDTFDRKLPVWAYGTQLLALLMMAFGLFKWVHMPPPKVSLTVPYLWMIFVGACGYLIVPFFFPKVNKK